MAPAWRQPAGRLTRAGNPSFVRERAFDNRGAEVHDGSPDREVQASATKVTAFGSSTRSEASSTSSETREPSSA